MEAGRLSEWAAHCGVTKRQKPEFGPTLLGPLRVNPF